MVFNSLYNGVDTAFLGHAVGSAGVAVTTLVLPVMTILMGFSMLAGQGGNALAAIQLGEGRKDQVEKTLGNAAALLVLFAAASAVVGTVLIDPLLAPHCRAPPICGIRRSRSCRSSAWDSCSCRWAWV